MKETGAWVQEKYERTALEYARKELRGYWIHYNLAVLRGFLGRQPIRQVIDIGCGSGALIRALAPEYPEICFTGIDFSEHLISLARASGGPANLRFICADIVEYQSRITEELSLQGQPVLMLLLGPFEHYHFQDPFAAAVRQIYNGLAWGSLIVTYHNKDVWCRRFAKGKRKQYWSKEDSLSFWSNGSPAVRTEYFHFFVFDFLISVLRCPWFHDLFLFLEQGLRGFPECFRKKTFMGLLHIFEKKPGGSRG